MDLSFTESLKIMMRIDLSASNSSEKEDIENLDLELGACLPVAQDIDFQVYPGSCLSPSGSPRAWG